MASAHRPIKVALIGNTPPQRCGIAEFTADLARALKRTPGIELQVFSLTDSAERVEGQIRRAAPDDYRAAAAAIDRGGFDLVCVQHEFGIFGGPAGSHISILLDAVRAPVVVTLHTVLRNPSEDQRRVFVRIARRSAKLIVMADMGRRILRETYDIPAGKIAILPHGVPDHQSADQEAAKALLGFTDRKVLMTFGLLSPNKGIDVMIRALPQIVLAEPKTLYVVAGATHPHLLAAEGEAYRERLTALAEDLGVAGHLCFLNEFVDRERLFCLLDAADVYVTPYLNEAQITSGTLSFAVGIGKAVISTPYWHAVELLADGRGRLAPFGDCRALAAEAIGLFRNTELRNEIRARSLAYGRTTTWTQVAAAYAAVFSAATERSAPAPLRAPRRRAPAPTLAGVASFTDDCGIFQHGAYSVPDRAHGYCVDDNARGLILTARLHALGHASPRLAPLATTFAGFVNHAWNADIGSFRNFMGYDRNWLEASGSQDSFGRAFWSLGEAARLAPSDRLRNWAVALSQRVMPHLGKITALRARAFLMLGLSHLHTAAPHLAARGELMRLAQAKRAMLSRADWFEPMVSYDNARLPEALLRAGLALGDDACIADGLRALHWLCELQTAPEGWFRPVGSERLGCPAGEILPFDQQPLEAAATIDACAAAFDATGDRAWIDRAHQAFAWFSGENDHGLSLAPEEEGLCFDGLTASGCNQNSGAESILSLQLAAAAVAALAEQAAPMSPARSLPVQLQRAAQ